MIYLSKIIIFAVATGLLFVGCGSENHKVVTGGPASGQSPVATQGADPANKTATQAVGSETGFPVLNSFAEFYELVSKQHQQAGINITKNLLIEKSIIGVGQIDSIQCAVKATEIPNIQAVDIKALSSELMKSTTDIVVTKLGLDPALTKLQVLNLSTDQPSERAEGVDESASATSIDETDAASAIKIFSIVDASDYLYDVSVSCLGADSLEVSVMFKNVGLIAKIRAEQSSYFVVDSQLINSEVTLTNSGTSETVKLENPIYTADESYRALAQIAMEKRGETNE